jgi:uncharacterized protein YcbX
MDHETESCGVSLTGLTVYPIKSAAGISAERWEVDSFGLRHDRRWMVVDQDGEHVTQRHHPASRSSARPSTATASA